MSISKDDNGQMDSLVSTVFQCKRTHLYSTLTSVYAKIDTSPTVTAETKMLRSSARFFCAHQLLRAIPLCAAGSRTASRLVVGLRLVAALPQASNQDVHSDRSTLQTTDKDLIAPQAASSATRRLNDALFWPEVTSADVPFDLTKTYVQRHVSRHFDTVIDRKFPAQYISVKSKTTDQHRSSCHNFMETIITSGTFSRSRFQRLLKIHPVVIGDTGAIKLKDIAKASQFIEVNRKLLLDVWEHGGDEANEVAWNYYEYIVPLA